MNSNYRETKNDLVHCPFNPAHMVKKSRLITHKKICPDRKNKGFVQCPYNPSHNVTIENLEKHKAKCPSRVIINPDLEKEMENFIKNAKNGIFPKTEVNKEYKEQKENFQINCNEIEGLNVKKMKKKNKKKNKEKNGKKETEEKEKAVDLENMTNKELFNFIFNDNMVIEYHSDSSENNDDDYCCVNAELKDEEDDEKSEN